MGLRGVGNWTIRALREIGVLDEVMETEEGLMVYPNAEVGEGTTKDLH